VYFFVLFYCDDVVGGFMGEKKESANIMEPVIRDLVNACKTMLPMVSRHYAGTPNGELVIKMAARAIASAENIGSTAWDKGGEKNKPGCFGLVGRHYDFKIAITKVLDWGEEYHYEGRDPLGRNVRIRVTEQDDLIAVDPGEVIYIRGQVVAHGSCFGEPVTVIETTSGLTKV
jgi:hypothetical protein